MSIRDEVTSSEIYSDYSKILKRAQSVFDYQDAVQEVIDLHNGRSSRKLKPAEFSVKRMVDANIQDQANRSRIVELRMSVLKLYSTLEFAMGAVGDFMIAKYGKQLGTNSEERQARVATLTTAGGKFLQRLNSFLEISEEAIKDIESTSWTFKEITKELELNSRPDVHV
jgi:chemotaxis methyl-accepting protein methylase